MTMPEGAAAQAEACWETIRAVLAEAGIGLAGILRVTYYVIDRAEADAVLAVCGRVLADVRPAATLVVVAGLLRPEMRVEIAVTAPIG